MAELGGLAEIIAKREIHAQHGGGNTYWFLERMGGEMVHFTAFEPDPNTHRGSFYYNSLENVLYKKINKCGNVFAWKRISF